MRSTPCTPHHTTCDQPPVHHTTPHHTTLYNQEFLSPGSQIPAGLLMLLEGALTSSSTGELCAMALQALLDTVLVDKQAFGVRWGFLYGGAAWCGFLHGGASFDLECQKKVYWSSSLSNFDQALVSSLVPEALFTQS